MICKIFLPVESIDFVLLQKSAIHHLPGMISRELRRNEPINSVHLQLVNGTFCPRDNGFPVRHSSALAGFFPWPVQNDLVGVETQFSKKKPPKTYRYDSSLVPGLYWDENPERPFAEWLLR